jgi:DnaJ-class molecular chaperone
VNYYEVLRVDRDAEVGAIKKAWRKVALACHPDRAELRDLPASVEAGLTRQFTDGLNAWTVLGDADLRAAYDRGLATKKRDGAAGGRGRAQRAKAYGDGLWRKAWAEQRKMAEEYAAQQQAEVARAAKKARDRAYRAELRRAGKSARRAGEKRRRVSQEAALAEAQMDYLDKLVSRLRCEIGTYLLDRF